MRAERIVGLGLCVVDHLYRVERLDLAARAAALNCTALGGGGRLMTLDEMGFTRRNRAGAGAAGGRD